LILFFFLPYRYSLNSLKIRERKRKGKTGKKEEIEEGDKWEGIQEQGIKKKIENNKQKEQRMKRMNIALESKEKTRNKIYARTNTKEHYGGSKKRANRKKGKNKWEK
jgi:hypothetical protein